MVLFTISSQDQIVIIVSNLLLYNTVLSTKFFIGKHSLKLGFLQKVHTKFRISFVRNLSSIPGTKLPQSPFATITITDWYTGYLKLCNMLCCTADSKTGLLNWKPEAILKISFTHKSNNSWNNCSRNWLSLLITLYNEGSPHKN